MMKQLKLLFFVTIFLVLSGCPRIAKIDIHNNTGVDISINVGGRVTEIQSGAEKIINFTAMSMLVNSTLGEWKYGRNLLPYHGKDDDYLEDIVYLQINENGHVFVVKKSDRRPIGDLLTQPEGFPIEPSI